MECQNCGKDNFAAKVTKTRIYRAEIDEDNSLIYAEELDIDSEVGDRTERVYCLDCDQDVGDVYF